MHSMMREGFEIFLAATPGLEGPLCAEARAFGFKAKTVAGGVAIRGGWADVWRANLEIRGVSRVIARIDAFRAAHLSELERRARRVAWADVLRPDVAFRVEASCSRSRIYHSGAAADRIEQAIGATVGATASQEAAVVVKARIDSDICTVGVDTSGEPLHKRGHKQEIAKAPMRETMAALFLRQCGFGGREPVVDPMCGSGTFVIEAAEIAMGLAPGRSRRFAFEQLASFDAAAWRRLRERPALPTPDVRLWGSDWDPRAVAKASANAERAGVAGITEFRQCGIENLVAPPGPPGLVIVNPPYGGRIGERGQLHALYRQLGGVLSKRFSGWRVGLVTSAAALAEATGLPFTMPAAPVLHGGLRITLYRTGPLP